MKNVKNTTFKDWIGLFVGIAVTALFICFCTPIYEFFYYDADFANEMYNSRLYFLCAMYTCIVAWAVVITYYWIIDRWPHWWHWLIAMGLCVVLAPVVNYYYPDGYFMGADEPIDFSEQLVNFSYITVGVSLLLFVILSFCFKSLSRNCATTPF